MAQLVQAMAGDVHAALMRLTEEHLGVTADEAEAKLSQLAQQGRLP